MDRPSSETIASVPSTIEVTAEKVGHALERLEQMEIRARLRPPS
ncbi:MAG: hypothetical protein NXH97_20940 [Rhodobacteraceae bacterium]|nr:hypothetical protein [Paracoccaceae bacterium]